MPSRDRRFQFTRTELQDASDAFERFMGDEEDRTFPLKPQEAAALKDVVRLAARVMQSLCEGVQDDVPLMIEMICERKFKRAFEIIDSQNRHFRQLLDVQLDLEEAADLAK